ncbi:NAD-dependent epimerase/dehydratase family protein [Actinopolymorpha sp. B11F2]|uniref:NAD-dependent epimerase/dehydratase family protein n=1 Tax=Actinopolymorpha sp. B11F2 TaxID=3160862 RepID=UPI0032E49787
MHVLVTGGLGFVGNAVAHVLHDAGHQVSVLTHSARYAERLPAGGQLLHADVRDLDALRTALSGQDVEGVCHLAGLARVRDSFEHPLDYFEINVAGTANLLRALADTTQGTPAVALASTGAVYGSGAKGKLTEDLPAIPDTPYAASKRAAEQVLEYHAQTGAVGAITLRCFAISGASNGVGDQDDTRIIPKALRVAAGEAPSITINGDGSAQREFTHVLDVADACRRALEATRPGAHAYYNVGTGTGISMTDVVAAVGDITGRQVPVEHGPPRPEPQILVADPSAIQRDLGWSAPRSGLTTMIRDAWGALGEHVR